MPKAVSKVRAHYLFGLCAVLVLAYAPSLQAEPGQRPEARRASDIGRAILTCWKPPASGGEVTVSLSFRRDGTAIDRPRVTFLRPGAGGDDRAALQSTIARAVRACTPIPLAFPLRAYVAGQVLRIRFVADSRTQTKNVSVIWPGT